VSFLAPSFIALTNECVFFRQIMSAVAGKESRARTLFHTVPENELFSVLSEYGLQQDMLPTDMGGSLEFDMLEWIENRRAAELEEI